MLRLLLISTLVYMIGMSPATEQISEPLAHALQAFASNVGHATVHSVGVVFFSLGMTTLKVVIGICDT
jgi:hypothetical protein